MVFSQLRSSLSVKVLDTGTGSFNHYTLTGYDTGGNSVATDSVPGATAATVLSLHVSTALLFLLFAGESRVRRCMAWAYLAGSVGATLAFEHYMID